MLVVLFTHVCVSAGFPDMEWQTPAVSEKFQSRFGRRPGTADSGDTGLGVTPSDSTEGENVPSCSDFLACTTITPMVIMQHVV